MKIVRNAAVQLGTTLGKVLAGSVVQSVNSARGSLAPLYLVTNEYTETADPGRPWERSQVKRKIVHLENGTEYPCNVDMRVAVVECELHVTGIDE
jgi:hypothetical protein